MEITLSDDDHQWLKQLHESPEQTLSALFDEYRNQLWQAVQFRLQGGLAIRIDPDDVLQESFLAAQKRLDHYLGQPRTSPFVWLRMVVMQTLIDLHRVHVAAQRRSTHRELRVADAYPNQTATSLAFQLSSGGTSPSGMVIRSEAHSRLEVAIAGMNEVDREIIALRHFEGLTNQQCAEILGLGQTAASNRYVRALNRLREILEAIDATH